MIQNEVQVYLFDCSALQDEALFTRALKAMPAYRQDNIRRLRFDEDKRRSLGAGLLLRYALGAYDLEKMQLNEHGKPYLEDCPYDFSLSHSGAFAALAVGTSAVGCDIQTVQPPSAAVIKRCFTKEEAQYVENATDKARAFCTVWAKKESYLKALGQGFSLPLNQNPAPYEKTFFFREYAINPAYVMVVCSEETDRFGEITVLTAKDFSL